MKNVTIKAEAFLNGHFDREVEVVMTVDADRVINKANCTKILQALYPNHSLERVAFQMS